MNPVSSYFDGEDRYPDLDVQAAAARLSEAIRCRTVNCADHSLTDFTEFDRLQALMRREYPNVMRCGSFELIGHAVLITIPGTDRELTPCLYMSHQDVVPVVAGTEKDWRYDAFSGAIAEGYIWGRGTLDIKNMVFGILEAAEYLLSRGKSFRRTAYLAFGDDEETLNKGALAIAETLEGRGVRLEFLLDEGSGRIDDGACFGAPGKPVSLVSMMEKGYADLELSVESPGGHSSRPFGGSSLAHLARAITAVADAPFSVRLPGPMKAAFAALAPYITEEPLRSLVQDVDGNADAIAACCAGRPETFPFVTTTAAPTMIEGGSSASNVLPQNMRAVINFRINEGDSAESVIDRCRSAVGSAPVRLRYLQANDPSAVASSESWGYHKLIEVMKTFYPQVLFIPAMTVGATDAHCYERICDCCLRCTPFLTEAEDARAGVHGTNERLSLRSYTQGIRVLIRMMELVNVEG